MPKHANPEPAALPFWEDENDVIHICESSAPLANELLIWTLCDREVESGMAFIPSGHEEITCRKCIAAERVLERRGESVRERLALA